MIVKLYENGLFECGKLTTIYYDCNAHTHSKSSRIKRSNLDADTHAHMQILTWNAIIFRIHSLNSQHLQLRFNKFAATIKHLTEPNSDLVLVLWISRFCDTGKKRPHQQTY